MMKMSGWEDKFAEKIEGIRKIETAQIQKANRLKSANEAIFFVVNVTIVLVTFTAHVTYFDSPITPTIVFTCLTLINILQFRMTKFFSLGIMGASEVQVSIKRIQAFLEFGEFDAGELEQGAGERLGSIGQGLGIIARNYYSLFLTLLSFPSFSQ